MNFEELENEREANEEEKNRIEARMGKLLDIAESNEYEFLSFANQYLIVKQLEVMADYLEILKARLSLVEIGATR